LTIHRHQGPEIWKRSEHLLDDQLSAPLEPEQPSRSPVAWEKVVTTVDDIEPPPRVVGHPEKGMVLGKRLALDSDLGDEGAGRTVEPEHLRRRLVGNNCVCGPAPRPGDHRIAVDGDALRMPGWRYLCEDLGRRSRVGRQVRAGNGQAQEDTYRYNSDCSHIASVMALLAKFLRHARWTLPGRRRPAYMRRYARAAELGPLHARRSRTPPRPYDALRRLQATVVAPIGVADAAQRSR
jgi:hypothetical protein